MIMFMSTLEERVLETILATKMSVPTLAKKIGVSVQSVYDWKKGKSLGDMKADNLIELAYLAGYEPRWIRKETGLKKKSLTKEQEAILEVAEGMEPEAKTKWIAIGASLPTINPINNAVDPEQAQPIQSEKKRRDPARREGEINYEGPTDYQHVSDKETHRRRKYDE